MIEHIQLLHVSNSPILNVVNNVSMLYDALCDLDEIIGMNDVKDSIIKQIKFLLIMSNDSKNPNGNNHKLDNHMLHAMVLGPPGVGKTSIGNILAKIWHSIGLVKTVKLPNTIYNNDDDESESTTKKSISGNISFSVIPVPIYIYVNKNGEHSYEKDPDDKIDLEKPKKNKSYDSNILEQNEKKTDFNRRSSLSRYIEDSDFLKEIKKRNEKNNIVNKNNNDVTMNGCEIFAFKRDIDEKLINLDKDLFDEIEKFVMLEEQVILMRQQTRKAKLLLNFYNEKHKHFKKPIEMLKRTNYKSPINIVSRPDFVGMYIGHTCAKTRKLLTNTLAEGKVLFIDEAYSLVLDEKDSFGNEALNEINRFMSEHPELIVIFAGYKDKMDNTIFKYQPGLKRRCTWIFEIGDYTSSMLTQIFIKQINMSDWKYDGDTKELDIFFSNKMNDFKAFGGDTLRLVLYSKLKYSEYVFDNYIENDKTLKFKFVNDAYNELHSKSNNDTNDFWKSMYM